MWKRMRYLHDKHLMRRRLSISLYVSKECLKKKKKNEAQKRRSSLEFGT